MRTPYKIANISKKLVSANSRDFLKTIRPGDYLPINRNSRFGSTDNMFQQIDDVLNNLTISSPSGPEPTSSLETSPSPPPSRPTDTQMIQPKQTPLPTKFAPLKVVTGLKNFVLVGTQQGIRTFQIDGQTLQVIDDKTQAKTNPQFPGKATHLELLNDESVIGKGGYGTVRLAYLNGRVVVFKEMNNSEPTKGKKLEILAQRKSCKKEIKFQQEFHEHENITTCYLGGTFEKNVCQVLELASFGSLDKLIPLFKQLKQAPHLRLAQKIFGGVVAALAFLHQNGVTHLDIKPGNILISSSGTAKLTDFGLAKKYALTLLPRQIGTPGYQPPEMLSNFAHRIDVFALGVTMAQYFSGQYPFKPPAKSYRSQFAHHFQESQLLDISSQMGTTKKSKTDGNLSLNFTSCVKKMLEPQMLSRPKNAGVLQQMAFFQNFNEFEINTAWSSFTTIYFKSKNHNQK